jgi:hypothetical protein
MNIGSMIEGNTLRNSDAVEGPTPSWPAVPAARAVGSVAGSDGERSTAVGWFRDSFMKRSWRRKEI